MGIFSRQDDYLKPFKRNERVLAAYDMPGVPERTPGVVKMVNGFEWRRYLVFFGNGVKLGSLDRSALVRPKHWHRWCRDREVIAAEIEARLQAEVDEQASLQASLNAPASDAAVVSAGDQAAEEPADAGSGTGDEAGGAVSADASRLLDKLPEHLRERSRLAKERLSG